MKIRILASLVAAFFMLPAFAVTAAALTMYSEGEYPLRPFTPHGTGTVLDNATDADGKEFFTITTPDGNVFYLIIDRQRGAQNVYFLNAVTEADLLSLAQLPERPAPPVVKPPPVPAEPQPVPEPVPEAMSGNAGMLAVIAVAALAAGGAGYYFKVHRPKQQGGDSEEFDDGDYPQDDLPDYDGSDWDSEPPGEGER